MIRGRLEGVSFLALTVLGITALAGCAGTGLPNAAEVPAHEDVPPATQVAPVVTTPVAVTASATVPSTAVEPLAATQATAATGTPAMKLTSTMFADGDLIPSLYTCDGQDSSPPLTWQDPPAGTLSFALICDDPDAPGRTWVHWVLYNIPPDTRSLAAGLAADATLPDGTRQGRNSWPRTGYGGPCPPSGTHRYIFNLYALDIIVDLEPGAVDKAALVNVMEGHVLAQTTLTGLYRR